MSRPPSTTICLDIPQGWLIGIDLYYFNSPPNFKGIKLVPTQKTHILHWGKDASSVRNGVVFEAKEGEILVFKWDAQKEEMLTNQTLDMAETLSLLGESYPYMLTYEMITEQYKEMAQLGDFGLLSDHVSGSVISAVIGAADVIVSSTTATDQEADVLKDALNKSRELREARNKDKSESEKGKSAESDDTHVTSNDPESSNTTPGFENLSSEATLHFPRLTPDQTWKPGSTGRERTLDSLDSSWYIENVLLKDSSVSALLGYFQLSFLLCLVLSNYSSSITWRDYIKIVSKGEELSSKNSAFYVQFLGTLAVQLSVAPAEYLDGLLELSALMEPLGNLKEIVFEGQRGFNNEEVAVDPKLKRSFEKLEGVLEKVGYQVEKPEEEE
ncbi:hypothetical protein CJU90_3525 [Yarrowia sp. C11]|nr:hypothetical protein CJU90_3525 [Yarrowia sp. C11]